MKKHAWLAILTALVLLIGSTATVYAEKLPPFGFGQIGLTTVALYDGLPVHKEPDASSEVVTTLQFRDLIIVTEQSDGWARCVLGDSEDSLSGWVETEYIIVDPAWYRTDTATPVYAWNDTAAPRIAILDANTVIMDPDTFLELPLRE